jgi:hypothetical protein
MRKVLYTDDTATKERIQASDNQFALFVAKSFGALVVIALVIVILFH